MISPIIVTALPGSVDGSVSASTLGLQTVLLDSSVLFSICKGYFKKSFTSSLKAFFLGLLCDSIVAGTSIRRVPFTSHCFCLGLSLGYFHSTQVLFVVVLFSLVLGMAPLLVLGASFSVFDAFYPALLLPIFSSEWVCSS